MRLPDIALLKAANTADVFAIVESNWRLMNAIHHEEHAIKRLTRVLVFLTLALVGLTVLLVFPKLLG
jgi:hypothetical protein